MREICENLLKSADFKKLYDNKEQLFWIGYDTETERFEGHYDLLASEARLLSYLAVCRKIPYTHWGALGREFTPLKGNTLYSWGGTAFEYLMPQLFLPEAPASMLKRSVYNAAKLQSASRCGGLFGVSESGYNSIDEGGGYRYKAFGLSSLALKSDTDKCVISPYSSFLILPYLYKKVTKNLKILQKIGGFNDKYGFYEAVDCTDGTPAIVAEHMSHHLGMSLAAVTNALAADAIKGLFMSDVVAAANRPLLTEPINTQKTSKRRKNKFVYDRAGEGPYMFSATEPCYALIGGDYKVAIDENGNGFSSYKGDNLGRFKHSLGYNNGAFFYVEDLESGEVYSPTRAPLLADGAYGAAFKRNSATFENDGKAALEVVSPAFFDGELRRLTVKNPHKKCKRYRVYYYQELAMVEPDADYAHPAFNDMFVKTTHAEERGVHTICAERRYLIEGEYFYVSAVVKGADKLSPVANRFNFIGRERTARNPVILKKFTPKADDLGDVLSPCIGFVAEIGVGARSEKSLEVITCAAETAEGIASLVARCRARHFGEFLKEIPFIVNSEKTQLADATLRYRARLFADVLNGAYPAKKLGLIVQNMTLLPDIYARMQAKTVYYAYTGDAETLTQLHAAVKSICDFGCPCCLAVGYLGEGAVSEINSAIKNGTQGGNYILCNLAEHDEWLLTTCAFAVFDGFEYSPTYRRPLPQATKKAESLPYPIFDYDSGEGGYKGEKYVVKPYGSATQLPYTNVIAGSKGGFITTANGGGYTWFGNSRENKFTEWSNDAVSDTPSESLYVTVRGVKTRVNGDGARVSFFRGQTVYDSLFEGINCVLSEYVVEDGAVKVFELSLRNLGATSLDLEVEADFSLCLGWKPEPWWTATEQDCEVTCFTNYKTGASAYLRYVTDEADVMISNAKILLNIPNLCEKTIYISISADKNALNIITPEVIKRSKYEGLKAAKALNCFYLKSGDTALDYLFNGGLMQQIVGSRLNAKSAFYQCGGATGFRDQLQDVLALIYSQPERARKQLLDCAAHQYVEGDVQHWWHEPRFGVRTRISDDLLFLPYVASEYVKATGDRGVLDEVVPYLKSRPLQPNEKSRYELPDVEGEATLSEHVFRAVECAYRVGKNGLLLIGAGDWNDALDGVGNATAGESVWLSMFYYKVISSLLEADMASDRVLYADRAEFLRAAVDKQYKNGYYRRLITKNGEWLGDADSRVLSIDLITQAWAVLSGIADGEKCASALDAARSLVDFDNRIIKLLWPPADDGKFYGYISKYPFGIRENGGQYTHGAAWYILALFKAGRITEGYKLLRLINPVDICSTKKGVLRYKGEPYVLSGDVYANPLYEGRAGWSWYTGSAAWYYKCVIEGLYGVTLENGLLRVRPKGLPEGVDKMELRYSRNGRACNITVERSDTCGFFVDGVRTENGNTVPLSAGKTRNILVKVK